MRAMTFSRACVISSSVAVASPPEEGGDDVLRTEIRNKM